MSDPILSDLTILVVEDEYLLADDLREALEDAGATVLGPVPSVEEAARLIADHPRIDAAVLDINLRGEAIFPVADLLRARGVPFTFATGYDQLTLPDRFANIPRVEKPLKSRNVASLIGTLVR